MSSTSSPALLLDVRCRRTERLIVGCISSAVGVAPWLCTPLTVGAAAAASVVCLTSLLWGLWRAGWLGGSDCLAAVRWDADGGWILTTRDGVSHRAALHPASRIAGAALWLRWRREGCAPRALALTALDSPSADLRRMLVRLRIEGPHAIQAAGESHPTVAA